MSVPAILALADGSVWRGHSIGATGISSVGEVVFNTAMSGYQEIISDPSYAHQLITFSYPHIGNTGCNLADDEASTMQASGIIIRDETMVVSSWRAEQSLSDYLKAHNTVGIAGIDTRALVKKIREEGSQHGCVMAGDINDEAAIAMARSFPGLTGADLAAEVSTSDAYQWTEGEWRLDQGYVQHDPASLPYNVVVYDFGVKRNILRCLVERGCRLTVVPATTPVAQVIDMQPDGVFLSNGPGDPAACDYAVLNARQLLAQAIPTFGICLGFQILALASGMSTEKMRFGHHGANHPVQDLATNKVLIASQNHGFTVAEKDLPANVTLTHRSLFDGTVQGFRRQDVPAFGVQGHPEASPGPHDSYYMFDNFVEMMASVRRQVSQSQEVHNA